jgi:HTH-type transcriptional regulator/antitoxin HigA
MRAFPIRNDADLERACALIEDLWEGEYEQDSPEANLLEVMSTLVDLYEAAHSTLPPPNPIELIEFKLRERGWSQRELARQLGCGSGRISEILSRKRQLTLDLVRRISVVLDIPPGLLVHDVAGQASADDAPFTTASAAAPGSVISAAPVQHRPHLRLLHGGNA